MRNGTFAAEGTSRCPVGGARPESRACSRPPPPREGKWGKVCARDGRDRQIEGGDRMKRIAIVAAALLCLAASKGFAQGAYPSKPLKLVVPVTTGGPSDLV